MATSAARTAEAYLAELPPERRGVLSGVRDVVRRHLPPGYAESMEHGMITYAVPLARYPDTYNGKPLCYVALAAQKHHLALYLMCAYGDPDRAAWLEDAFREAGKRYDAGKSCLRFQTLDDLPLDAIGQAIAECPAEQFITRYETARRGAAAKRTGTEGEKPAARQAQAQKPAAPKPTAAKPSRGR